MLVFVYESNDCAFWRRSSACLCLLSKYEYFRTQIYTQTDCYFLNETIVFFGTLSWKSLEYQMDFWCVNLLVPVSWAVCSFQPSNNKNKEHIKVPHLKIQYLCLITNVGIPHKCYLMMSVKELVLYDTIAVKQWWGHEDTLYHWEQNPWRSGHYSEVRDTWSQQFDH